MKWYHGYQQVKAFGEQQGDYDDVLKAVKKQFGDSAGLASTAMATSSVPYVPRVSAAILMTVNFSLR
ncbi:hypothetical protein [Pseudomonas sp. MWU12-2037]|uniref:hypothetical protein n=1 Tax=Pseudomonas sp. MWU12-2037 TaxID=2928690 RepID=UPI00200C5B6C|nr:hypothetical protein [Pseudomonas sp. MWU12-2037]